MRRTTNHEDTADVVAETFAIAWRRIDDIPGGEREVPWLYAVARRVIANRVRRNWTQSAIVQRLAEQLAMSWTRETEPDSGRLSALTALGELSEEDREILMLAAWDGLTSKGIGWVISCSPTAARIRLHRARGRLNEAWVDGRVATPRATIAGDTRAMRNSLTVLRAADPVRRVEFQELGANPVFDELLEAIVTGDLFANDEDFGADSASPDTWTVESTSDRSKRPRLVTLMTIAAALVLLAAGLTLGLGTGGPNPKNSLPNGAQITPWHAARQLPVTLHPSKNQGAAKWQLVGLVVDQGWHVNTSGPPPGQLTCPTITTCYALAVRYASPKGGARPESVSLYLSADLGTSWSVLPMPTGFLPTSHLSCPSSQVCAVGGTRGGQPAFAVTIDGGHQWGVVQMSGSDSLRELVCRSAAVCVGVLRSSGVGTQSITSVVRTDDGGASWASTSVPISGTVLSLSCPTDQVCVAVGYSVLFQGTGAATGFVLRSDTGGQTWTTGTLPQNFGFVQVLSAVSCAGASDCMAIGVTTIPNPDRCQGTPPNVGPPPGHDSCSTGPTALISAVVTSSNGGSTWQSRALPADIPMPQLYSLSCASATVCWASGQEAVPQVIGNVHDDGSPVMVGTTDGGATWSKATFAIPSDAPNYLGQAYLAVGDISCPGTSACLALGIAAQSAPSTPIYRYGGSAPS